MDSLLTLVLFVGSFFLIKFIAKKWLPPTDVHKKNDDPKED